MHFEKIIFQTFFLIQMCSRKKAKCLPGFISLTNLVEPESSMLYTNIQLQNRFGSGETILGIARIYIGIAAILIGRVWPFGQTRSVSLPREV